MAAPFQKCKQAKPPCEQARCGHPWTVRYREPGGRSGRQREKSFPRKREADQFATRVEHDKYAGVYFDQERGRLLLRDWAEQWFRDGRNHKPNTARRMRSFMDNWLLPKLGDRPIGRVTSADLQKFVHEMEDGLAASTIGVNWKTVTGMMSAAVGDRIRESPCKGVVLPTAAGSAVDEDAIPSVDEVKLIAKLMREDELFVWLMACTGLRASEALGLSTESVRGDFIRLRHQLYDSRGGKYGLLAPLKHREPGEYRDIPLPLFVAEKIDQHTKQHGTHEVEGQHVLFRPSTAAKAPVLTLTTMGHRWWRRVNQGGELTYTSHDLRHAFASTALANNVPIHEVSRWLGHSSIRITVDVYGHLTPEAPERCRTAIQDAYADAC